MRLEPGRTPPLPSPPNPLSRGRERGDPRGNLHDRRPGPSGAKQHSPGHRPGSGSGVRQADQFGAESRPMTQLRPCVNLARLGTTRSAGLEAKPAAEGGGDPAADPTLIRPLPAGGQRPGRHRFEPRPFGFEPLPPTRLIWGDLATSTVGDCADGPCKTTPDEAGRTFETHDRPFHKTPATRDPRYVQYRPRRRYRHHR